MVSTVRVSQIHLPALDLMVYHLFGFVSLHHTLLQFAAFILLSSQMLIFLFCFFFFPNTSLFFSPGGWALWSLLYPKTSLWWCKQNEASLCNVSCQQSSSREFNWNQQELQGVHRGTSSLVQLFCSCTVGGHRNFATGFNEIKGLTAKLVKQDYSFLIYPQVNAWYKDGWHEPKELLEIIIMIQKARFIPRNHYTLSSKSAPKLHTLQLYMLPPTLQMPGRQVGWNKRIPAASHPVLLALITTHFIKQAVN